MSCSCCSSSHSKEAYEPFIDPFDLAEHCHLDNYRTEFKNAMIGPDSDGWGESRLQSLPIELYQACLQHLDIATLTAMRCVSQFTRYTIDSLHQYKELYDHAPQALRACLATGVAPHIPLKQIHHSFINMECYYCKTSYVLLFTMSSLLLTPPVIHPNPHSDPTSPSTTAAERACSACATIPNSDLWN